MSDQPRFQKGDKVFRRHNPGEIGYITGPHTIRAGDIWYQVEFPRIGLQWVPECELGKVDKNRHSDPISLIEDRIFGKAIDLRRHFTHIQISGRLSNFIYSLNTTNTDFHAYQFKPVLAFLESPSNGLLIADEVGLGKTIEAGLIWTELRARYDYRRILVVCPAMLREKWRDELRNRFGVEAAIMDAGELLDELQRPSDQISDGKGIICSIQGIRQPRDWQPGQNQPGARYQLANLLHQQSDNPPFIELVVIDEAHYLRNRESQSSRLGKMLRDVAKHIILLSAMPINLKNDDLFSLLNIVDQDTFARPEFFSQVLEENEPLTEARRLVLDQNVTPDKIRKYLKIAARHNYLGSSQQLKNLIAELEKSENMTDADDRVRIADRIDQINLLRHAVNRTRRSEVNELNVVRTPQELFVDLDDNERNFYDGVTDAIKFYATEQEISEGFLLANPQRQVSSCMYAAAKAWRDKKYQDNDYISKEMINEDIGIDIDAFRNAPPIDDKPLIEHLVTKVLPSVDLEKLRAHDSKFNGFHKIIRRYFEQYPNKKIVVFSYFRATLDYLHERLAEKNIVSRVLVGGMKESKQDIIDQFRTDSSIKILLSSEVASEGVDLQFCSMIVNYDLPWNPMKIEQRIGRLDRIGQESETIIIWNLGYENSIDQRIYERLFDRLEIFERALGGMEAILGEKIKELTDNLIKHDLSPEQQEQRIEQTATAIANNRNQEEKLEKEASNLIAHHGYILNKVQKAYNLQKRITEDDLVVYVREYLNKHSPGHEFYQPDNKKLHFHIRLPAKKSVELAEYVDKKKLGGKTQLTTGDRVHCKFINKTNTPTGNIERIDQFHPLIRFIREEISKSEDDFFPLVAIRLNQEIHIKKHILGQYAFSINKWDFNGLREERDIQIRAVHIENNFFLSAEDSYELLNAARLYGSDWAEAKNETDLQILKDNIWNFFERLNSEFKYERDIKKIRNEDHVNFQIQSAKRYMERQINSLQQVLENYRSRNETRMIPATEGRIEKIETRFNVQIASLEKKKEFHAEDQQICCGVLLLE